MLLHKYYKKRREVQNKAFFAVGALAGLTIGTLIGGVAGVLNAPQSGEKTRKDIKKKKDKAIRDTKKKVAEIQDEFETVVEDIEGDMSDIGEAVKEDYSDIKETVSKSKTKKTVKDKLEK